MLIVLAPAKAMDMTTRGRDHLPPYTEPKFRRNALQLVRAMRRFSASDLGKMMKIAPDLADLNYERYQIFGQRVNDCKEAIVAYDGIVYKMIDAATMSGKDLDYAQGHLRIISTLYGLVRPLDCIEAYRLAFGLKPFGDDENLYKYWTPLLTDPLITDIERAGGVMVNLASQEVIRALDMEKIKKNARVVSAEFQELHEGKYRTIRTYAKMCRGLMTRYIVTNRIEDPEGMKKFMWNGFAFNPEVSRDDRLVFTRERRP